MDRRNVDRIIKERNEAWEENAKTVEAWERHAAEKDKRIADLTAANAALGERVAALTTAARVTINGDSIDNQAEVERGVALLIAALPPPPAEEGEE